MAAKRDYYEILGVDQQADEKTLKQAYRKVALQFHPDRNPGDAEAEGQFKEAAEAYEVLSDQRKRQMYDRFGHDGVRGRTQDYSNFDDVLSSFGSIFEDFFGGGGFGGFGGRRGERPVRGEDLRFDLSISFEEAARGVEKHIDVQRLRECEECGGSRSRPGSEVAVCSTCRGRGQVARTQGFFSIATPCPRCRGEGQVIEDPCPGCEGEGRIAQRSSLNVKIPGGVDDGARLRMGGEGEGGSRGGPAGDLYIFLSVEPHDLFERDGNDVVLTQPISVSLAALGGKIKVPTLDGEASMSVAAGTQTGDVSTLRGKGFPNLRGFGKGVQQVRFRVDIPKKLSREQKRLFEELSRTFGEEP